MSKFFVAGRIEFLGKHTDYCGGRSLVCAIDKGFLVDYAKSPDTVIRVVNLDTGERTEFPFNEHLTIGEGGWKNYPKTVAKRLALNFKSRPLKGLEIRFSSDLPQAAGVSSSSAFVVAIFNAISEVNNLPDFEEYRRNIRDKYDLGNYLGCLENGYNFGDLKGNKGVGTFGGSQDQTAIICCHKNTLSRFSFRPVRHEGDFSLPDDLGFVVAASGVAAEKTGAAKEKYNRLSLMSQEIAAKIDGRLSLAQILEEYGFDEIKAQLGRSELVDRLTQFYRESFEIIPEVSELLGRGEITKIGRRVDYSHQNADRLLGNQVSETNFLQRTGRELGAVAASAFGAGFGGSVYALVRKSEAQDFLAEWQARYFAAFPQHREKAEFFVTNAGESRLDCS
jgi:galactokinase